MKFIDRLNKALERTRSGIFEDLYGFRTVQTDNPIDILIHAVDQTWADWNFDSKFQDLANRAYGGEPPKTPEEWISQIEQSSQSDELKQILIKAAAGAPITATAAAEKTGPGPATIIMKTNRLTEGGDPIRDIGNIEADMVSEFITGNMTIIMAGIGPPDLGRYGGPRHNEPKWRRTFHNKLFYTITGSTPPGQATPHDPSRTLPIVQRKYGQVLHMNPKNIEEIRWK